MNPQQFSVSASEQETGKGVGGDIAGDTVTEREAEPKRSVMLPDQGSVQDWPWRGALLCGDVRRSHLESLCLSLLLWKT